MGFSIGDVFGSVSDALFGDPNQALNAQQKSNNQSREYTKEMADQAAADANRLYYTSAQPLQQGYQAAIDALGGTARQQIDTTARGNYYGQEALLSGMPQFQNAILGNPVDNSALQPKILHPERNLDWMFNTTLGTRSGGHNSADMLSTEELDALKQLHAAGLSNQQIRDLNYNTFVAPSAQGASGAGNSLSQAKALFDAGLLTGEAYKRIQNRIGSNG